MPPIKIGPLSEEEIKKALQALERSGLTLYKPSYDNDLKTELLKAVEGVPKYNEDKVPTFVVALYYYLCEEPNVPNFKRTK